MKSVYLKNAQVYVDGAFVKGNLLCQNGKICSFSKNDENVSADVIDCKGKKVIPGFIDAHTHGAVGVDVNSATSEDLNKISAFFASQGTTAWNASVLTDTKEKTLYCISQIIKASHTIKGAELMGVHLEGPFLSPEYKGAMPEYLLKKADIELFNEYYEAAEGKINYITVAPEVEGVVDLVKQISDKTVVSLGHSAATYDITKKAIKNGARCSTHTFNAMRLFHQHEPAIMGAVLESDDIMCEAICDGRHLVVGTINMLLKCKGWDKVFCVTDSIMATGLPDGKYKLGVNDIVVKDGDAKLADCDVRAGSTLTTITAMKNLIKFTGQPLEKVIPLLTINPARALKMDNSKGSIASGKDADILVLDDNLDVELTIVKGNIVYRK